MSGRLDVRYHILWSGGGSFALSITVGSRVWIGGGTVVTPGAKIGSNVVIGADSVVVHDIPDNCVDFGNPCKLYRAITQEDLDKMRG